MGLRPLFFLFFPWEDRLYTSGSDVYRRQILTYNDDPRAEKFTFIVIFIGDCE